LLRQGREAADVMPTLAAECQESADRATVPVRTTEYRI
jgi:hypothetical protein